MPLRSFQQGFIQSIRTQNAAPLMAFSPSCRLTVDDGLSIYAANMSDGLVGILQETFSSVYKLVGDDFFRMMGKSFVESHIPTSSNMNDYGGEFPKFIETYAPASSLPYLSDVARFDWQWNDSYFAADDADLDLSLFSALTPEDYQRMGLVFKASVSFMASDFPVDHIWEFCESNGQSGTLDIHSSNVFLMIWRVSNEVNILRLTKAEYLFMVSLKMGIGLVESIDHALREDPNFLPTEFIQKFLSLKTVKSITLAPEEMS